MFCPSCGIALPQQVKYCNRCGTHINTNGVDVIQLIEKRMDSEMEGLFWITVFGLGLILGGTVLMKKMLFSEWLIIAYMIVSVAALLAYFGLGVWQVRRLARSWNQLPVVAVSSQPATSELAPEQERASLGAALSVTEHTTRTLEPIPQRRSHDHPAM